MVVTAKCRAPHRLYAQRVVVRRALEMLNMFIVINLLNESRILKTAGSLKKCAGFLIKMKIFPKLNWFNPYFQNCTVLTRDLDHGFDTRRF